MVWLYVPELEASSLELNESLMNTKPFVMLRGKPSAPQSLRNKWKKGGFIRLLSGLTFEPSTASLGVESWIASLRDSHANHSAKQESKKEQKNPGIFGLKSPELLAKFDPHSSSWKTFQASLLTPGLVSLETWPKWGIIRGGVLFEHQTPQHIIDVRGGFASRSIPTPTCMDSAFQGKPRTAALEAWKKDPQSTRGLSLHVYAQKWPTPTAIHAERGNHDEAVENYLQRVQDFEEGKTKGRPGMSLGVAVRFPTPDASPQKYRLNGNSQQSKSLPALAKKGELSSSPGRLNPDWVEWLMGWPIGWTDCEHVGTE
jgi:hypothetical protein